MNSYFVANAFLFLKCACFKTSVELAHRNLNIEGANSVDVNCSKQNLDGRSVVSVLQCDTLLRAETHQPLRWLIKHLDMNKAFLIGQFYEKSKLIRPSLLVFESTANSLFFKCLVLYQTK